MPVININNDDIRLNSSSSDKVVVNGNLGIGTTAPDSVLDVNYKDSSTNIIRVSNGSGNYRFRVDQNFNMFMTNASFVDTVGIYNNGNAFFGGNVGIGTTSPGAKLHVDNSSADAIIRISKGASTIGNIDLVNEGNRFSIQDDGARRLVIDTSGNVGIGTTSPSEKLHISGAGTAGILIDNTAYNSDLLRFRTTHYSPGFEYKFWMESDGLKLSYAEDPSYTHIIHYNFFKNGNFTVNTGNVGIGTTSPAAKLQVGSADTASELIRLSNIYDTSRSARGGINWHDTTSTTGRIYTEYDGTMVSMVFGSLYNSGYNSNNLMIIRGNGNVGIGTTNPTEILNIARTGTDNYIKVEAGGQAANYSGIMLTEAGINWGWSLRHSAGTDSLYISYQDNTPTFSDLVTFTRTGNVGIGTTAPSAKLDVNGDINLTNYGSLTGGNSSNRMAIIKGTGASGNIEIGGLNNSDVIILTHVNERMRITGAGNVGIGTTAPKTILDIRPAGITGLTMPTFGTAAYGGIHIVPSGAATTEAWYGITFGNVASTSSERERSTAGIYTSASGTYGNKLYFATSNDWGIGAISRMMIDEAGNVGIGTTSPVTQLQVASATNAVDVLRIGNTAGDSGSVQGVTHLAINHFNAGTNPSTRITAYQDGVSGWPGGMYFSTRSLNTDSAPVERMRITSGGNVGIGTTSPSNILHITNVMRMDNATGNAPAVTSYTPRNGYGDVETERCLADPAVWLKINIGGTEYVIPAYTQA